MGVPYSKGVRKMGEVVFLRLERRGKTGPKIIWVNGHWRSYPMPITLDQRRSIQMVLDFGLDPNPKM